MKAKVKGKAPEVAKRGRDGGWRKDTRRKTRDARLAPVVRSGGVAWWHGVGSAPDIREAHSGGGRRIYARGAKRGVAGKITLSMPFREN